MRMRLYLPVAAACFLFLIPLSARAATFTSVQSGNWNDGATWGNASPGVVGTDFPGEGDTATIGAQTTVTIPAGYSASVAGITYGTGVSAHHTILTINGTLTLGGDLNMSSGTATYAELTMSAGSTLNMGDYDVVAADYVNSYNYIHFVGMPESRITVSSSGGGFILAGGGGNGLSDIDLEYVDATGLGTSFQYFVATDGNSFTISHSTFTTCGTLHIVAPAYARGTPNSYVEYSDFITPASDYPLIADANSTNVPAGRNEIVHSTFSSTIPGLAVMLARPDMTFSNNVLKNVMVLDAGYGGYVGGNIVQNNVFWNTGAGNRATAYSNPGNNATFDNNYIYTEGDNPHPITVASSNVTITNNISETNTQGTVTDDGDFYSLPNGDVSGTTIANNILIGTRNDQNVLSASGGGNTTGTIEFSNNTNVLLGVGGSFPCFTVGLHFLKSGGRPLGPQE